MFFLPLILVLCMLSKDHRAAESNAEPSPALPGTHRAKENTMDNTSTSRQGSFCLAPTGLSGLWIKLLKKWSYARGQLLHSP